MHNRQILAMGYALTGIAGWVDAQGFLALQGVFVSFMSGNTTLLGLAVTPGNASQAGQIALVIVLFLGGGFAGAFVSGLAGRWAMPAVLASVAAVLAVAIALSATGSTLAGAVILALAMGIQNAAAGAVGPVKSGATYVTGTLVSAGQELGRIAGGGGSGRIFAEHMSLWLALLVGVAAGAVAHTQAGLWSLLGPAAAATALAACTAAPLLRSFNTEGS
ncbi:YoaK family protein [Microbaculum marinum]|uniref:DUF1275 family protein n=1 Tax=Microbaculum marinum TaxID=1764581 RepID=A0AAW9RUH0_9HYPH